MPDDREWSLLWRQLGQVPDGTVRERGFVRIAAIALAQQKKARSFEMRSALALAKLYQSSGSAADAYAVLAPTLEGFTPTQELPEIEQAQQLLAVLKQQSKR